MSKPTIALVLVTLGFCLPILLISFHFSLKWFDEAVGPLELPLMALTVVVPLVALSLLKSDKSLQKGRILIAKVEIVLNLIVTASVFLHGLFGSSWSFGH